MGFCRKCGAELLEDANCCHQCGESITKSNESNNDIQTAQDYTQNSCVVIAPATQKKAKKFNILKILIPVVCVLFAIVIVLSILSVNKLKGESNGGLSNDKHNETGVALNGVNISWANMSIDDSSLRLTDDQKTVLRYFDDDYFDVTDYESIQRYPQIFRHAQITFCGHVIKVLEMDDENYTCVVELVTNDHFFFEESEIGTFNTNVVVKGKQSEDGRLVVGDYREFYGRYDDVAEYTIDGSKQYYPTISIFYALNGQKFDDKYIKNVAKIIFGSDVKLEDPLSNNFDLLDEFHPNGYSYYLVTLDNQTNANFSSFEFSNTNGFIRDANLKQNIERQFFVSADFKHYIITVFDRNLKTVYLEYYDRDFKKIWSKEFEDTDTMQIDYSTEKLYIITNNDLYGLDISNGKELFDPVFVGEKVKINMVKDGVILIGKGNRDNIMKLDLKGKMLWKSSIDLEIGSCSSLQIIDDNIVGYYYSEWRDGMNYEDFVQKMVSVDKDGKILSEFVCDNMKESV